MLVHEAAQAQHQPLPAAVERKMHQTIHKVTADTESLDYNTAIAAMMEYLNLVREEGAGQRAAIEPLLVLLARMLRTSPRNSGPISGIRRPSFGPSWPAYDEQRAASGEVEIVGAGERQGSLDV